VKIPANKLEEKLQTHPKVEDAAILEVYMPPEGFAPRGFIVLKSRKSRDYLTLNEVNKYLESIMNVRDPLRAGLQIVDKIPRRSDGRIIRTELKGIYYNDLRGDGEDEEEDKEK
jgi:acyl-coenzyme A synthetase/AMP-(fatty) acid ligase